MKISKTAKLLLWMTLLLVLLIVPSTTAYAFKPAAHYVLMEQVTQSLPEDSVIRAAMEEYPSYAAWGANGPDLGYGQMRSAFDFAPWADRYHYDRVGTFAVTQLKTALASNDPKKIAWAAGWVTHITGDLAVHGILVNPEAGVYLENPNGRSLHGSLEEWAEPYVWSDIGGHSLDEYNVDGFPSYFEPIPDQSTMDFTKQITRQVFGTVARYDIPNWIDNFQITMSYSLAPGYHYIDHDTAVAELQKTGKSGLPTREDRLIEAFYDAQDHAIELLTNAEADDYSGFSDAWNIDASRRDGRSIGTIVVTVHTANVSDAGTDDNVYLEMISDTGASKKWQLDIAGNGYNDFEQNDTDDYYLFTSSTSFPLNHIKTIRLSKSKDGWAGGWLPETIKIRINGLEVANKKINKWLEDGSLAYSIPVNWRYMTRLAYTNEDGSLYVKEGGLSVPWKWESDNVDSFQVTSNRIGMLTTDGELYVKEGSLDAPWVLESDDVASYQLSGNRIGVLDNNGTLNVKDGKLDANWVSEADDVKTFQLNGNRIGALHNNGGLYVKDGSLSASWVLQADHVVNFQLSGNRIGALSDSRVLNVKDGSLNAAWVGQSTNVLAFQLNGNRIGAVILGTQPTIPGLGTLPITTRSIRTAQTLGVPTGQSGAVLYVKDGALNAQWIQQTNNVASFQLYGSRIGVLLTGGTVYAKEGTLTASWVQMKSDAASFQLNGDRTSVLQNDGSLYVKEGRMDAGWVMEAENVGSYQPGELPLLGPISTVN